jgi:hypothetical protein
MEARFPKGHKARGIEVGLLPTTIEGLIDHTGSVFVFIRGDNDHTAIPSLPGNTELIHDDCSCEIEKTQTPPTD